MPVIPYSLPGESVRQRVQSPPVVDPFAPLAGRVIELNDRISAAYEESEATRIAGETSANLDGAVDMAVEQYGDPDEFGVKGAEAVKFEYDKGIGASTNPRVQEVVAARIADNYTKARNRVAVGILRKKIEGARVNSLAFMEATERELLFANDEKRAELDQKLTAHMTEMARARVWSAPEIAVKVQGIRERDSFNQIAMRVQGSLDPIADLPKLLSKYRYLSPDKFIPLMGSVDQRRKDIEKMVKDDEDSRRKDALLNSTMAALNGQLDRVKFDVEAKVHRYSAAEYQGVLNAAETGGVTDPNTVTALELAIYEGRIKSPAEIANNRSLDQAAKSRLMAKYNEVARQKKSDAEEKHFSKTPEYTRARESLRLAVTPKGPMESLDKVENARLEAAYDELWTRVGGKNKEDPIAVADELRSRIARDPVKNEKPLFTPRFQDEAELVKAYREGRITREQFNSEALLMKKWQQYNQAEAARAGQPPSKSRRPGG